MRNNLHSIGIGIAEHKVCKQGCGRQSNANTLQNLCELLFIGNGVVAVVPPPSHPPQDDHAIWRRGFVSKSVAAKAMQILVSLGAKSFT